MLTLKAYAKINLTLEVLGRRDDGYHEVATIMQTVDLHDTVSLTPAEDITLSCDDPALESPDNLAYKAAQLLRDESGYTGGAHIAIEKAIPVSAGLGGGSSDAAATLRGLNDLWRLNMSTTQLQTLAARLGSDVPFLLQGGTAIALGRGERVRHLPPADIQWMVVLTPDVSHTGAVPGGAVASCAVESKTAALYGKLTPANYTRGFLTRKLEARIRGGHDLPAQFLFNAFDDVAFDGYPGIEHCWNTFTELGAREIHLSGSGPSMYALMPRREVGTAIHLLLRHKHGMNAHLVQAIQPDQVSPLPGGEG